MISITCHALLDDLINFDFGKERSYRDIHTFTIHVENEFL